MRSRCRSARQVDRSADGLPAQRPRRNHRCRPHSTRRNRLRRRRARTPPVAPPGLRRRLSLIGRQLEHKTLGVILLPKHYSRRLRRVMYMSALTAVRCDARSRAYYQRKPTKESDRSRPPSAWPDAAPTCSTPSSVTTAPATGTTSHHHHSGLTGSLRVLSLLPGRRLARTTCGILALPIQLDRSQKMVPARNCGGRGIPRTP